MHASFKEQICRKLSDLFFHRVLCITECDSVFNENCKIKNVEKNIVILWSILKLINAWDIQFKEHFKHYKTNIEVGSELSFCNYLHSEWSRFLFLSMHAYISGKINWNWNTHKPNAGGNGELGLPWAVRHTDPKMKNWQPDNVNIKSMAIMRVPQ